MGFLHPDDTMDLSASPHMPDRELDMGLDTMHNPSAKADQEILIEDVTEPYHSIAGPTPLEPEATFDDHEMLDEDLAVRDPDQAFDDLNMYAHRRNAQLTVEEDLPRNEEEMGLQGSNTKAGDRDIIILESQEVLFNEGEGLQEAEEGQPATEVNTETAVVDDHPASNDMSDSTNLISQSYEAEKPSADIDKPGYVRDDHKYLEVYRPAHPQNEGQISGQATRNTDASNSHNVPWTGSKLSMENPDLLQGHDRLGFSTTPHHERLTQDSGEVGEDDSPHSGSMENSSNIQADQLDVTANEHDAPAITDHHLEALHPVRVLYNDSEICLFPPNDDDTNETFFLSDVSLANQGLDKLLGACRDVLTGTIGDDDELVLDVASLGLHISEGSMYAAQITFSSIMDVYLALSHNDNLESIPPLYCTLTSRVSLASQYAYLLTATQEGKTYSQVEAEHLDSPYDSDANSQEQILDDTIADNNLDSIGAEDHLNSAYSCSDLNDGGQEQDAVDTNQDSDPKTRHVHEAVLERGQDTLNERQDRNKSAPSPIRGDEASLGGYEPLLSNCDKPVLFVCMDCNTNKYLGRETSVEAIRQSGDGPQSTDNDHTASQTLEEDLGRIDSSKPTELAPDSDSTQERTDSSGAVDAANHVAEQLSTDENHNNDDFVTDEDEGLEEERYGSGEHQLNETVAPSVADQAGLAGRHFQPPMSSDSVAQQVGINASGARKPQLSVAGRNSGLGLKQSIDDQEDDLLYFDADDEPDVDIKADDTDRYNGMVKPDVTDDHEDLFEADEDHTASVQGKTETHGSKDYAANSDESIQIESAFLHATPPTTPTGSRSDKRKAQGDDDIFDFLDTDTPNAKRRRSS